jgi:membrane protease YdiL (CAAX protease family)
LNPLEAKTKAPELRTAGAFLLVLVAFAAYLAVAMLTAAVFGSDNIDVVFMMAAQVVAPLLALYMGLRKYAFLETTSDALRLGPPRGRQLSGLLLAIVAGGALSLLGEQLNAWIFRVFPPDWSAGSVDDLTRRDWIVFVVAQVALLPFAQELLFRGFIQPRLQRTIGVVRAFVVTLALFAAAQPNPRLMPAALLVGAATGLVVMFARTTWAAILTHVAFMGMPFLLDELGVTLPNPEGPLMPLPWYVLVGCTLLGVAALGIIRRLGAGLDDAPPR